MKRWILFLLLGAFSLQARAIFTLPGTPQTQKLPSLGLDKDSVTVSGISAGAFLAVQLGVAYSQEIKGVGVVAGGIYECAEGNPSKATDFCMKTPEQIAPVHYESLVSDHFSKNLIDNPQNIASQKIYILNGTEDKTVMPDSGKKLQEFYQSFNAQITTEFSLKMGHAFPSNKAKNACEVSQFPWVNNCHYDGAKNILQTMYGDLKPNSAKLSGELIAFDQSEFDSKSAGMLDAGNAYIPANCKPAAGARCRLHIALHGCLQSPNIVQGAFTQDAGYNEWADTNNIVILYPAVGMGSGNPNGCWDWWGYTGSNYTVKSALQMKSIMKMAERLELN